MLFRAQAEAVLLKENVTKRKMSCYNGDGAVAFKGRLDAGW